METVTIPLPDIGTTDAVTVIAIPVSSGDTITENETMLELESDKATMEVPSPVSGIIEDIHVKIDDEVRTGDVVLTVSLLVEQAQPEEVSDVALASESQWVDICVPDIGSTDAVDVIDVVITPGMTISREDTLLTLESEKASMDVPSPYEGIIEQVFVKTGDTVKQGDRIAQALLSSNSAQKTTSEKTSKQAHTPAPVASTETTPVASERPALGGLYAGPAVRRMAREFDLDLSQIKGTGRKGRIQKEDVQRYVKERLSQGGSGLMVSKAPSVDFAQFGDISTQDLTRIQKRSAENLHRNWVSIPHVTQFEEADVTDMEAFRQENKILDNGVRLTPLVFMMKAVVSALKKMPKVNASLDASGTQLILKHYYNIGVAVDTPNGLVVPVIRSVDHKSLHELAEELSYVSQRARDGQLKASDMQGQTFTISSLGGIGGTAFTPIINAPDVAILGVSKMQRKPVYDNGGWVPRLMMPLSLSYDHRVIDGADAARFTTLIANALADIRQLLL